MAYKTENKEDYSLLVRAMLDPMVAALTFGVGKHGRLNYLTNPKVTDDELLAAARRHALEDPGKLDDESGVPHGGAAMANLAMWFHRRAALVYTAEAAPQAPTAPCPATCNYGCECRCDLPPGHTTANRDALKGRAWR